MRVLLFTGKGGVGKTTVAAATALAAADAGLRTVALSTDPAHSLGDALEVQVGPEPAPVAPGLHVVQIDAQRRLEENWGEIQSYIRAVLSWGGAEAIEAEELSIVPGLDELFALTDVKRYAESGIFDCLIVDCAPTAETIRLLSLPDVLAWYMERLFPIGRQLAGIARPFLERVTSLPIADDEVFATLARLYDRLDGVREILSDPEVSSVRLVVNPESMVIAEARRMFTYLCLFGYRVDAVLVNRLLPDAVTDPYFDAWKLSQARHLEAIESSFAPVPVLRARLFDDEVVGPARLRALGEELYEGLDPLAVLHDENPLQVGMDGDDYVVNLRLPFTAKDEVDISRLDDEVFVTVGGCKRTLLLPQSLSRRPIIRAGMDEDLLEIRFGRGDAASTA